MRIHPQVQDALDRQAPVVALESTIISHGMPYPQNVETALAVEEEVRAHGACPATLGLLDGEPVIGMTPEEIEEFGRRPGVVKVSRRDLPVVMARKLWGATTVAGTMILAERAGIEVFVTGGIGGVHRGASQTFDISADLQELARTSVTVVCAGIKAILDLPSTLEYLETFGVPVLGYGSDELAAFYSTTSHLKLEARVDTVEELAEIVLAKRDFGLDGGVLVSNPLPEEHSMDEATINRAIEEALAQAERDGIRGKAVTPYLLERVKQVTGGRSLEANIALIRNNARLGARLAGALSRARAARGASGR